MAVRTAVANGNWSAVSTWDGGASIPQTGDEVRSNGYTVIIDIDLVSYTFLDINNTGGGGFTVNVACVIGSPITAKTNTATVLINLNDSSRLLEIYGKVSSTLGFSSNRVALINNNTGTILLYGNVEGVNQTSNNYSDAIRNTSTGKITVIGDVSLVGTGGGYSGSGINNVSTGTIEVTGNITGGCSAGYGIWNQSTGTINVTGIIQGGSGTGYGIYNASTAINNIVGTVISSATTPGIYSTANCSVYVNGIITTQTPPTATVSAITLTTGTLYFSGVIINTSSTMAVQVSKMVLLSAASTSWTFIDDIAGTKTLYSTDTAMFGYPAEADVRDMTIFGQANEFLGGYKVAPQNTVLLGVPNDNGVGTLAPASASDVWDHLLTGISVAGSIGKLIKDNLDVVVSSRSVLTAQQVWDVLLTSLVTPGSIGKLLVDDIDTKLSDLPTLFWSKVIDGTYTADKVLKVMASILAGKTVIVDTGNNTATVTFRNLDDTSDVVKANMNNSERIIMTLTP